MKTPFIGRRCLSPARARSAQLSMGAGYGASRREANPRRPSDSRLSSVLTAGDGKAICLSFRGYQLSGV